MTPVALLTKLLGRKPETSANLAAEIDGRKVALSEAQARVSAAASARAAALADLDADGMARAEAEAAAAARLVEVGAKALDILTAAHAKAMEAEQAEAKAEVKAALVERRRVLGQRYETEWRRAAATLAEILSESATLARDISEHGFDREIERSPEVSRGLSMHDEAISTVSKWLNDSLASPPTVSESSKERAFREHKEARARREAEQAEARRVKLEAEREEAQAEREADRQAEAARSPFYPSWRDHLTDTAR